MINKQEDKISNAVIRRLPRYLRVLEELNKKGVVRISSGELSDLTGYTASQIRQDLNHFGGFGQQGYGYNIADLQKAIEGILGTDKQYNMVIVGCGRLGHAVANYIDSYESHYRICGIFDVKDELIGKEIAGVKVQHQRELEDLLAREKIDIGVITATKERAQSISGILVDGGVRGIWNFVPADIAVPDTVIVENIYIADSLHVLTYNMNHQNR
ncbi:MAG: redox-sensing transcriptional repressor Rex [Firmicutes bacterium]|nr:redox-sensing transcriptional repressor Rex [Bacillota bacterium]MBQ1525270.1 redox-sensing transcriptional repressor Rex [Bacillota bacterium]MBQ1887467.1 redox-sensing transcriptional repressor Rex [Bacillota bacterium]MBQ2456207.1 redox-sensing transcriptional repressor Rex [Bacillota bacterium]MBQ3578365.1 redox-sensing transcriptional repressor Rex [Bacillota bacterium]